MTCSLPTNGTGSLIQKRGNTGLDIIKDVVGGLSVGLSDSTPSAKRPVTVSDYIDCMCMYIPVVIN